ncbi:hypothetical protein [Micromonospora sp. WP24]|uniref:hypothetical protein n=1 Tax=Micromonospora sp. WP24 TaxID=2604469 RepID=UPI002103790E|nr:hypothetical protein [Micromonospora sp. WP24]
MSSGSERGQVGRDPKRPDQGQGSGAATGHQEDGPERHVREGRWPTEAERRLRPGEPDVLLDVPELRVGELRLAVDALDADLSLRARLANLVVLDAGVRVRLEAVELDVKDVLAEVLLKVRLERLAEILERALDTLDRNPQLVEAIAESAHAALDDAGRAAQQVTGRAEQLDRVADRLGQDVGSISARASWTGEGPVAREMFEPSRPGERQPGARPGETAGERPRGGTQRPRAGLEQPGEAAGGQGPSAPQAGAGPGPSGGQPGGAGQGQRAAGGDRGPSGGQAGGAGQQATGGAGPSGGQPGGARQGQQATGGDRGPSGGQGGGAGQRAAGGGQGASGPQTGAGAREREAGRAEPGEGQAGGPGWPVPNPADLAGQAGEVLRQAGRSVWDAIRASMTEHGPESKR